MTTILEKLRNRVRQLIFLFLLPLSVSARSWGPPQYLSAPGQDATHPYVAFNGRAIPRSAIWQRFDGESWRIETKNWVSGAWQDDVDVLSAKGYNATEPRVAYINGSPTAVWQLYDAPFWRVQGTRRLLQQWETVHTLSSPHVQAIRPEIGFSRGTGVHHVVWQAKTPLGSRIESAHRALGWSAPVILSDEVQATHPKIAGSPTAQFLFVNSVWTELDGQYWRVRVAQPIGLAWQPSETLSSPGYDAYHPQVAISNVGTTRIAVWQRFDGRHSRIESSRHLFGAWQAPQWVSEPGAHAVDPRLAYPSSGPIVIWRQFDGARWRIKSSRLSSSEGIWEKPVALSSPERNAINLGISSGFNAICWLTVAIWDSTDEESSQIEAAVRVGIRDWSETEIISPVGHWAARPHMSVDNQSTLATAVWEVHDGENWRIQTADRRGSCD